MTPVELCVLVPPLVAPGRVSLVSIAVLKTLSMSLGPPVAMRGCAVEALAELVGLWPGMSLLLMSLQEWVPNWLLVLVGVLLLFRVALALLPCQ